MADTKEGREKQAANEQRRQREREIAEAQSRADEREPPLDEQEGDEAAQHGWSDDSDASRKCHRRDCESPATFVVLERYQEETGHGAVEAEAALCREHTDEESPTNLDGVYADYLFQVTPIPEISERDS